MRIAFMGTPDFAVPILGALVTAGHEVAAVYSQPPRASGRGQRLRLSSVHQYAEMQNIEVRTPARLRDAETQTAFSELNLDAAVVAAYGLILPKSILDAPQLGCINIHASLLPRWRGAAPIQHAILAGDSETGVTIMQMDEGLDTGDMLLRKSILVTAEATAATLHDELSELGATLIVSALAGVASGTLTATPQSDAGVTLAPKIQRDDGCLDWRRPAVELDRAVRAYTPWPSAWFEHGGERIKVLAAELVDQQGTPGTVLDDQLAVACGSGALRPLTVQRAGKAPIAAAAFLRGYPLIKGARLA